VAETAVKRLMCCWFRRTDKAMGQVYQCWWSIWREINVFSRLYPFVNYLLAFRRRIMVDWKGLGRKWSWLSRGTIAVFSWRNSGKSQKGPQSGWQVYMPVDQSARSCNSLWTPCFRRPLFRLPATDSTNMATVKISEALKILQRFNTRQWKRLCGAVNNNSR
jgi:hypothetical protein